MEENPMVKLLLEIKSEIGAVKEIQREVSGSRNGDVYYDDCIEILDKHIKELE